MGILIISFIVSTTLFILSITKIVDQSFITIGLFVSVMFTLTSILVYLLDTSSLKRDTKYKNDILNLEKEMTSLLREQIKSYQEFIVATASAHDSHKEYVKKLEEALQSKNNTIQELKQNT